MVSTRGVKFKFSEGEKVLCYEPDPTKAKVLYDSKVLEVIVKKDNRGRKTVEYLIHFQGWNSSWDRCVGEDYVLKDTDDNRRLQRTLSDKAQLQLRERKQQARRRKTSDRTSDGAEEGGVVKKRRRRGGGRRVEEEEEESSGVEDNDDNDNDDDEDDDDEGEDGEEGESGKGGEEGGEGGFSFGEEDEEEEEDEARVPLSLSDNFKKLLEEDEDLITCKNKLVRLPATPNVVSILEGFMKQYALNQLFPATMSPEKRKKQPRSQHHHHRHSNGRGSSRPRDFNKALRSLNLCKEVVDGIRIYFDHTLSGLLLYEQEKEQYEDDVASLASLSNSFRIEARSSSNKCTPTKVPIKQEHDHSVSSSPDDFFTVLVKEEPRTGDSDRELSESNPEVLLKTPVQEGNYAQRERPSEEKRRSQDCREGHFKYVRHENPCDSKAEGPHAPGAFHNTMSSAASTSSCCSTPSCLTPSNHPSSVVHNDRTSMGHSASENALLMRVMNWKMIPDGLVHAPSQLYGATHLARLFVKLPDLLHASGMHEKKLKVLLGYLHSFLEYLEEHTDWFGEAHYKDNPLASL